MERLAAGRGLSALPKDVLRIVLKDISLQDRLQLELVDRSHGDALREPELWQDLNLGAMQALHLSEKQLLCLLERLNPGLNQFPSQIGSIAKILSIMNTNFMQQAPSSVKDALGQRAQGFSVFVRVPLFLVLLAESLCFKGSEMLNLAAHAFLRCHKVLPDSWGPIRYFVETSVAWFSEQVMRIPRFVSFMQWFLLLLLHCLGDPVRSMRGMLADLRKKELTRRRGSGKAAVNLDVSWAASLSPEFVAACVLGLSAAGFKVDLKMVGDSDPPFPLYHVVSLLRILAVDCSMQVNMLIHGLYPAWRGDFLKGFNPESLLEQGHDFEFDPKQALLDYTRESRLLEYEGSEASYRRFQEMILKLHERTSEIAAASGRPDWLRKGSVRPRMSSPTVVLESMSLASGSQLYDDIREYLKESPSKLRLVFRNCQMRPSEMSALFDLLGECGAGSVSFQQSDFRFSSLLSSVGAGAILTSAALQESKNLRRLELDCPFFPHDVPAASFFLLGSQNSSELVIHLRMEFFSGDARTAQRLCSKLRELCDSAQGTRVRIVQHRRPSRFLARSAKETVEGRQEGLVSQSFLSPIQQEIDTDLWYEKLLDALDYVIEIFGIAVPILAIAELLGYKMLGFDLWPSYAFAGPAAVRTLWRPLRATIQGRPSWLGIAFGLLVTRIVPLSVIADAFRSFWAYIGICLLWTIVRQLFKAVGWIVSRKDRQC